MDNDRFKPSASQPLPEPPYSRRKDPFAEPPVKDFTPSLQDRQKQKHTGRKVLTGLLVLIILAGGGTGAYWQFFRHKTTPVAAHATTKAPATPPPAVQTIDYTSNGFGVTFKYPKGWAVTDNGATSVTILSPAMSLTAANGQKVSGKIVVVFQPQGQIPSAFGTADATAVLTSQSISYKEPTPDQAAQTYLSFVQYNSTTTLGGLDGIYLTGNNGYQKNQTIPHADVAAVNPLVAVTFGQCTGTNCANVTNLTITSTSWNSSTFSAPILAILKSLSFS
jgi:hypothetical protein